MKNVQRGPSSLTLSFLTLGSLTLMLSLAACTPSVAQTSNTVAIAAANPESPALEAALPDEPQPQQPVQAAPPAAVPPAPPAIARKYALMIEPGQKAPRLTAREKFIFSLVAASRPITIAPELYSAGYEQVTNGNPRYGSDSGAFAARFGAGMAHSVSTRLFGEGLFAAAFHQDPRYYRVAHGSFMHRSVHSALQALVRRGDNGTEQINYSGLLGRGAAAGLVLAYYPPVSQTTGIVFSTWAISIASDAGGNLVLEFLPDVARKFPVLKRIRVE